MRISIRRCLSMLRNTSDGNELALPATNAYQKKEYSVASWYTVCLGSRTAWLLATGIGCCSASLPLRGIMQMS